MEKFLSALFFCALGATIVRFWPNIKNLIKSKNNNNSNSNDMSRRTDYYREDVYNVRPQNSNNAVDESRPATTAVIYRSELDYISKCILDCPNIETGGQLFGFWTNDGVPVILYAIGPGPNANHQVAFFVQDSEYFTRVWNIINPLSGIQHIGEWHSHHKLGLSSPSGHDASTIINGMRQYNKHQFLLCIGNCTDSYSTLNAYNFREPNLGNYTHAAWDIKELDSPFRLLLDSSLSAILCYPANQRASHGNLLTIRRNNDEKIQMNDSYWLTNTENHTILKNILDYVNNNIQAIKTQIKLDSHGFAHLVIVKEQRIYDLLFGQDFPQQSPIINKIDGEGQSSNITEEFAPWNFEGDIYNSIITFLNSKSL